MHLAGKVALVTGGGSGIGAALVRRLAGRGAQVAVLDIDGDAAGRVAAEVAGTSTAIDVADPDTLRAAISDAELALGRLDVVFLNAGVGGGQSGVGDLDDERYRQVVGVNVDHVVVGTCAAVPALRRTGGGTIVVTASLAGLIGLPLDPIYTLTKHAVVGYVRAAAARLAADGVRLCALCPGFTDTALVTPMAEALTGIPLLTPQDVADAMDAALAGAEPGEIWLVQPGRPAQPYRFRGVPGPRATSS